MPRSPPDAIAATASDEAEEPQVETGRLPPSTRRRRRPPPHQVELRRGSARATISRAGAAARRSRRPQDAMASPTRPRRRCRLLRRVAALAAAALERRNAPPVSSRGPRAARRGAASTSVSARVDEAEERPDRLRSRLRLKARSSSDPLTAVPPTCASWPRGPDGTTPGFLRSRTIAVRVLGGGGGVECRRFACLILCRQMLSSRRGHPEADGAHYLALLFPSLAAVAPGNAETPRR